MTDSYTGIIKSYGLKKGFGFITTDELPGEEVYFSNRNLPMDVLDSLSERSGLQLAGQTVTFTLMQTEDGKLQAGQVLFAAGDGEDCTGKVKSYNPAKGYGFLVSSSVDGDVFFMKKDLPSHCQDAQLTGCSATFKLVIREEDGKPQARQVSLQGVPQGAPQGVKQGGKQGPSAAMQALPWMSSMGMGMGGMSMGVIPGGCMAAYGGMPGFGLPAYGGCGGCGGCWTSVGAPVKGGGKGASKGAAGAQRQERDRPMHGVVKSYDDAKGFGFITNPEVPRDIYFKGEGGSYGPGDRVSFYLNFTSDGKPQARAVTLGFEDGEACEGTVKSYNSKNGWGFVQVSDRPGDIYFKKNVVPDHMQDDSLAGMAVTVVIHLAPDGKPQVQQMDIQEGHAPPRQGVKRALLPVAASSWPTAKRARVEASPGDGQQLDGMVKSYNMSKGFGFVRTPHLEQDIYFKGIHPQASAGVGVRFVLNYSPDGKPQAANLRFHR